MGNGILVMATQMMMTTLIIRMKKHERRMRDNAENISRDGTVNTSRKATTTEILASPNEKKDACSLESTRLSATR
jgi:hypothetical protein